MLSKLVMIIANIDSDQPFVRHVEDCTTNNISKIDKEAIIRTYANVTGDEITLDEVSFDYTDELICMRVIEDYIDVYITIV